MLVFLGTLILIVLGVIIYAEYRDAKAEQIAHDKYVRDSIATARKDSILLAQQKDQMRRDSIKFVRELPKESRRHTSIKSKHIIIKVGILNMVISFMT